MSGGYVVDNVPGMWPAWSVTFATSMQWIDS